MRFLDTNIFLRYIAGDVPDQTERCRRLIERIEIGEEEATTSPVIVAEVVYVLSSRSLYNVPRHEIRDQLSTLLALRGMQIPDLARLLDALDLFADSRVDIADALTALQARDEGMEAVYSFDRDFDRLGLVPREEPA